MKKILGWVVLALVVMWVMKNPTAAAADLKQFMHAVSTLVGAL